MRRLEDKIALVTGAGAGIGRAVAETFAREGAHVVVADRDGEAARETADAIVKSNGAAQAETIDVTDTVEVKALMQRIADAFGRLDVLVNNAGYGFAGSVVDTDEEAWDALMAVNVRGVFLCAKHAIPAMAANGGGSIVNTASVVAAVGIRNRAAYCASKGAVAALTRAIAIDHVAEGIRCNAVAPGTIDTPYFDEILRKSPVAADTRKALEARQLMNRLGTPEEIAAGILFLASDESRFATGSVLTIDGGMTAQ
jgi:meso-butanediol dehydrogenase/(S,S)-butanediol dehydrogenase/diacetyl reductase